MFTYDKLIKIMCHVILTYNVLQCTITCTIHHITNANIDLPSPLYKALQHLALALTNRNPFSNLMLTKWFLICFEPNMMQGLHVG